MTTVPLGQAAAVALGCALAAFVAERDGIRAFLIKGHAVAEQGLRKPRRYADVDVWVDPLSVDRFVLLLEERGWRERGPNWVIDRVGSHSVTLVNESWPCDIDVHRRFPGFLAPDEVVFDELWRRRTTIVIGGRTIVTPDRAGNAAILALHSMRHERSPRGDEELDYLVGQLANDSETVEEILKLAAATGANETLTPLLKRLGTAPRPGLSPTARALREWNARQAHMSRTGRWLAYFRDMPLRAWPREMLIAAWPSAELYRQDHPEVAPTRTAMFWGRIRRLINGATGLLRIAASHLRGTGRHR